MVRHGLVTRLTSFRGSHASHNDASPSNTPNGRGGNEPNTAPIPLRSASPAPRGAQSISGYGTTMMLRVNVIKVRNRTSSFGRAIWRYLLTAIRVGIWHRKTRKAQATRLVFNGTDFVQPFLTLVMQYLVLSLGDAKQSTAPIAKTLNPEWNEAIDLPINGIDTLLLEATCWDKDRWGKDYMGEFDVALEDVFTDGRIRAEVSSTAGDLRSDKANRYFHCSANGTLYVPDGPAGRRALQQEKCYWSCPYMIQSTRPLPNSNCINDL